MPEPVPSSPFDSEDWWEADGFLLGLHALLDPVRIPYFISSLTHRVPAGGRVLDLGCGGGYVAAAVSAAGYEVVGIDPSTAAVRAARATDAGHFAVAYGEQLPFPPRSFNAAICSEVLEHVSSPGQVLSEIARALLPGGTLLFSLPNRTWTSHILLIDMAQRWRPTRVLPPRLHEWDRFIRPDELGDMLTSRGLQVDEVRGLTISPTDIPRALNALVQLKRRRLSYQQAGRRVELRTGRNTQLAYLGSATLQHP